MRAVRYDAFRELPELVTVDDPVSPRSVVIQVAATGLCRSDWHAWMGHDPGVTLPHVPGHEFSGVVAAVGSRVERWCPGAGHRAVRLRLRRVSPVCAASSRCATSSSSRGSRTGDPSQNGSRSIGRTSTWSVFRTPWTSRLRPAWVAGSVRPTGPLSIRAGERGRLGRRARLWRRRSLGGHDRIRAWGAGDRGRRLTRRTRAGQCVRGRDDARCQRG